ncbi:helix-turn-helix domain-containing protein [Flavobacterium hercynium]|uniref:HTH araC/xylS-type domain-containing protein n=1 Tax=Flavobacterium hercynium TaxID=387094 RepID=A0A226H7B2_9FLAO|nr:AraC family transcriptional regulator [Flavobacterium hercynium]OXA89536.1 hypothetical protein B0A66_14040 [Flavobacterium hercynium]SMP35974.1 AraC-type DNA-binding protein [Flavobacterium hercynium]
MKEINHYYTLTSEWHNALAKQLGATVKNNKLLCLPESIGKGHSLFLEVVPGLSALLLDIELSVPLKITRLEGENDLRIFHFDLSDEVNSIQVEDSIYPIGYTANLGFAMTSNDVENTHKYDTNKRIYSLRLIVDRELFDPILEDLNKYENNKDTFNQKALYFSDYIDSNSKILLYSIKNKSILDNAFDFHLKGISLSLLANFVNRYAKSTTVSRYIKESDLERFRNSTQYLRDNLKDKFPGVPYLAKKAEMSASKYKSLFQKIEKTTPYIYFVRNKMLLARKLIKSGSYLSIKEVVCELNYKRKDYFSVRYYEYTGRKPSADFVKKK